MTEFTIMAWPGSWAVAQLDGLAVGGGTPSHTDLVTQPFPPNQAPSIIDPHVDSYPLSTFTPSQPQPFGDSSKPTLAQPL